MQTDIGEVNVRLDRVTIVGAITMSDEQLEELLEAVGWHVMPVLQNGHSGFIYQRQLSDEVFETIAVLLFNKFQNSWRLDTSNHLCNSSELATIQAALDLMTDRHTSRIDVAFDFINCKYAGMKHVIVKPGTSVTDYFGDEEGDITSIDYYGRRGALETKYVGKRSSLSTYRYYDKLVEQLKAHKEVPDYIESWERLEIQLRQSRTEDWAKEALKMLSLFKMPNVKGLSPTDQMNLLMLTEHPEVFEQFNKQKKAKYRKMYRENIGMNNDYEKCAYECFVKNVKNIQNEVNNFLLKFADKK